MEGTYLYTRTHRTQRAVEWSAGKIVILIVTLAATCTVTLARDAAKRLEWLTGFKGSAGSAVVLPEEAPTVNAGLSASPRTSAPPHGVG